MKLGCMRILFVILIPLASANPCQSQFEAESRKILSEVAELVSDIGTTLHYIDSNLTEVPVLFSAISEMEQEVALFTSSVRQASSSITVRQAEEFETQRQVILRDLEKFHTTVNRRIDVVTRSLTDDFVSSRTRLLSKASSQAATGSQNLLNVFQHDLPKTTAERAPLIAVLRNYLRCFIFIEEIARHLQMRSNLTVHIPASLAPERVDMLKNLESSARAIYRTHREEAIAIQQSAERMTNRLAVIIRKLSNDPR